MDLGFCEKLHSDDLKAEFERSGRERERDQYESLLDRELSAFVNEADRKIKVSQYKLSRIVKRSTL